MRGSLEVDARILRSLCQLAASYGAWDLHPHDEIPPSAMGHISQGVGALGDLQRAVRDAARARAVERGGAAQIGTPDERLCLVCLGSLDEAGVDQGDVVELPCGHQFHDGCLVRWVSASQYYVGRAGEELGGRCPVCRTADRGPPPRRTRQLKEPPVLLHPVLLPRQLLRPLQA